MKSDIILIDNHGKGFTEALEETKKVASYTGLEPKLTTRLQLMTACNARGRCGGSMARRMFGFGAGLGDRIRRLDGLGSDNTTLVTVVLKKAVPAGFNVSDVKAYHDGTAMTPSESPASLDQFKYDPLLEEIQLKKLSRILSSNDDKTESKSDKYDPEEPEGDVPARSIEPYDVDGAVGTGLLAAADLLFVDDDFDY